MWYKAHPYSQKRGTETQPVTVPCYLNSPHLIERQFKDHEGWGADECKARRTMIVKWMERRWSDPLEESQSELVASFDAPPFFDISRSAPPRSPEAKPRAKTNNSSVSPCRMETPSPRLTTLSEEQEDRDHENDLEPPVMLIAHRRTLAEGNQKRQRRQPRKTGTRKLPYVRVLGGGL
jgi:hypothetical protein